MASTFHKLGLLKDQGDLFISDFKQYISQIVAAGESWTEGGDNQVEYLELDKMIDTAVEFIKDSSEKLSNASAVFAAQNRSPLSSEQPDVPLPSATAAVCDRPAARPRGSIRTTLHRQPTEPALVADETQLKQVLDRLTALEEELSSLRGSAENVTKQVSLDQEHERRIQRLETQLEKLSTSQDRMKVEVESQAAQTVNQAHIQLQSVKENLNALDARIDTIVDDGSKHNKDIANIICDIKGNVMVISEWQDEKMVVFRELEQTVQKLETDVKNVQEKDAERETNLKIQYELVNDRIERLEQLRTCLALRPNMRDDFRRLDHFILELEAILPRFQLLELKSSQTGCGFSAEASFSGEKAYNTVGQYTILFSTPGENFDADSGIFTAPVDGLYGASISLCLAENEDLEFSVRHKHCLEQVSSTTVCECSAKMKGTTTCGLGVVGMKAGEVLITTVYQMDTNDYFKRVTFSCFLLR